MTGSSSDPQTPVLRSHASTGLRAGHAALAVIVGLLSACGAVLAFVAAAFGPNVDDLDAVTPSALRSATNDAVALAVAAVWGPLEREAGTRGVRLDDGRARLDELGLVPGGPSVDLVALIGDERPLRLGEVIVERVDATRTRSGRRTFVHFDVVVRAASASGARSDDDDRTEFETGVDSGTGGRAGAGASVDRPGVLRSEQVFELTRAPWDREGFALAARQFETTPDTRVVIDSAARVANRDAERAGSFAGARAALLGDFVGRHDLTVVGSLFVGGRLLDRAGREVFEPARAGLSALRLDAEGRVVERTDARGGDGSFAGVERVVVPTFAHDTGVPEALYLDQRTRPSWPGSFPDFDDLVASIETGGTLVGSPARLRVVSEPVTSAEEAAQLVDPTARRAAEEEATRVHAVANGSLVGFGVPGDPLVLDGDLLVEGDLVLAGEVRGAGRLFVRGTAYLPTDLVSEDGAVAIVAGHSVVVGQPFDADGRPRACLERIPGTGRAFVAPTNDDLEAAALAHLFEALSARRARWRPLRVEAALHACEALVVAAGPGAVGLAGAVDLVGCATSRRLAVDAPAGLRVLFDPRAPSAVGLLDPERALLRRLGAPLTVAP